MRPLILILSLAALPGAAAATGTARPAQEVEAAQRAEPQIVRHADGSFTITRPLPAIEEALDALAGAPFEANPPGSPRSRSEKEADEALDAAYQEAVDMARQEAGPD